MQDNKTIDELIHWDENRGDYLYHWGIKGMKWGVRRYQNKDGSLTAAGRARQKIKDAYDNHKAKKSAKKVMTKSVKDLTDEELAARITRLDTERRALDLERQVKNLSKKEVSAGRQFIADVGKQVVQQSLLNAGRDVLTSFLKKKGMDLAGLGEAKDFMSELKKEADRIKKERDISDDKRKIRENALWNQKQDEKLKGNSESESRKQKKNQNKNSETSTPEARPKDDNFSGAKGPRGKKREVRESTNKPAEPEAPKKEFKVSNSNAQPVHDVYSKYYARAEGTVDNLYKSGYMMTSLSNLEGTAPSSRTRNTNAWLGEIGDWKMKSLEDMEKYS